ncbi:hypothetical protein PAAG_11428 [Paracoccidioides lutzii Pb01]|uniref:Uncharacterized protein n=1 Tax=Paracoccidioides lutzii (strain ATCC MYA-826 / Pb01) TaxID=502779 RepID=A0A0A2V678_PARBA|nr:hypothetical protein PAAG_11428 [Paracoccidioides lutzii Pb01]KGQ01852.1 hypothetical protein PAAG_11428 [Paracoccidioides lutzii Pb01]
MRTRSQPISPGGLQSLQTVPRRKKSQTDSTPPNIPKPVKEATAKGTKTKSEKKTPAKRGPKKGSKKSATKSEESATIDGANALSPTKAAASDVPTPNVDGDATPEQPAEASTNTCEQPIISSTSPIVTTPVDSSPVPILVVAPVMDPTTPTPSVSGHQAHLETQGKQSPSPKSVPKSSLSTLFERVSSPGNRKSGPHANFSSSASVGFPIPPAGNPQEPSGVWQIPATNAPSAQSLANPYKHSTRHHIIQLPCQILDTPRTQCISLPSLDRSTPNIALAFKKKRSFSLHSQNPVSQGCQSELGVNSHSVSQIARPRPIGALNLDMRAYPTSSYRPLPAVRGLRTLLIRPG